MTAHYITINGYPWCEASYRNIDEAGLPDVNESLHERGIHPYIRCATDTPERDLEILREFYKDYPQLTFDAKEGYCPVSRRAEEEEDERREAEADRYDLSHIRNQRDDLRVINMNLRVLLEDLVQQYAYELDDPPRLTAGGMRELEHAFKTLGWEDPHPVPDRKCDEAGCTKIHKCGWKDENGKYRITCREHTPSTFPR